MLKRGSTIGLIACSDPQPRGFEPRVNELKETLNNMGLVAHTAEYIYSDEPWDRVYLGKEKARQLERMFEDNRIEAIFDISGGNLANTLLPYLNFDIIKNNPKPFFAYSDNSTILNAIYKKTGQKVYLYQILNLIRASKDKQIPAFEYSLINGGNKLFEFDYSFAQGDKMEGIMIGGNLRCLLKLAGTEFFPDTKGKILFLEGLSSNTNLVATWLTQLRTMGVFENINGILLGTFTDLEKDKTSLSSTELAIRLCGREDLPIAKTARIGHGGNSKALKIGEYYKL